MTRIIKHAISGLLLIGLTHAAFGSVPAEPQTIAPADKLVVLWTSGDRDVAMNMVFMYTLNAKLAGWWQDVTFILNDPSAPEYLAYIPNLPLRKSPELTRIRIRH